MLMLSWEGRDNFTKVVLWDSNRTVSIIVRNYKINSTDLYKTRLMKLNWLEECILREQLGFGKFGISQIWFPSQESNLDYTKSVASCKLCCIGLPYSIRVCNNSFWGGNYFGGEVIVIYWQMHNAKKYLKIMLITWKGKLIEAKKCYHFLTLF